MAEEFNIIEAYFECLKKQEVKVKIKLDYDKKGSPRLILFEGTMKQYLAFIKLHKIFEPFKKK